VLWKIPPRVEKATEKGFWAFQEIILYIFAFILIWSTYFIYCMLPFWFFYFEYFSDHVFFSFISIIPLMNTFLVHNEMYSLKMKSSLNSNGFFCKNWQNRISFLSIDSFMIDNLTCIFLVSTLTGAFSLYDTSSHLHSAVQNHQAPLYSRFSSCFFFIFVKMISWISKISENYI